MMGSTIMLSLPDLKSSAFHTVGLFFSGQVLEIMKSKSVARVTNIDNNYD